jgi:hypothetical protein
LTRLVRVLVVLFGVLLLGVDARLIFIEVFILVGFVEVFALVLVGVEVVVLGFGFFGRPTVDALDRGVELAHEAGREIVEEGFAGGGVYGVRVRALQLTRVGGIEVQLDGIIVLALGHRTLRCVRHPAVWVSPRPSLACTSAYPIGEWWGTAEWTIPDQPAESGTGVCRTSLVRMLT